MSRQVKIVIPFAAMVTLAAMSALRAITQSGWKLTPYNRTRIIKYGLTIGKGRTMEL